MQQKSRTITVPENRDGQRLDNFLQREMKGLPRAALYRLIRTGQVRVNSGRCKPARKLRSGDQVRIPPARFVDKPGNRPPSAVVEKIAAAVLFDDGELLVLNKPTGLAVHAGSGLGWGLIDAARLAFGQPQLDLAHRLDRETSGCLVLARNRRGLNRVQSALQTGNMQKAYLALAQGNLAQPQIRVELPLRKVSGQGGERVVVVDAEAGKPADSEFHLLESFARADYLQILIRSGRTHQIRVHARAIGHPLAGDTKYGDRGFNRQLRELGLKRLFLHAQRLDLPLAGGSEVTVSAPLPDELSGVLDKLAGGAKPE